MVSPREWPVKQFPEMLGDVDGTVVGIKDGIIDGVELGLALKEGIIDGEELGTEDGKAQCGEVTSNSNTPEPKSRIFVDNLVAVISSTKNNEPFQSPSKKNVFPVELWKEVRT